MHEQAAAATLFEARSLFVNKEKCVALKMDKPLLPSSIHGQIWLSNCKMGARSAGPANQSPNLLGTLRAPACPLIQVHAATVLAQGAQDKDHKTQIADLGADSRSLLIGPHIGRM